MLNKNLLLKIALGCTLAITVLAGCNKDGPSAEPKDKDGNVYKTVEIGSLTWFAENLKTTKYRNGDDIEVATTSAGWTAATEGVLREGGMVSKVSYLYNYAAISDSRDILPKGWRIPTAADFEDLKLASGGGAAGYNLKTNTSDWSYPNELNVNMVNPDSLGFTALPNGYVNLDGNILGPTTGAAFWTSTEASDIRVKSYELYSTETGMVALDSHKKLGLSCRCVKD